MVRILFDAEFVVLLGNFGIVRQEVKGLAVAKVCGDTFRVELSSVLEVLDSLLVVTKLSKKRCIM